MGRGGFARGQEIARARSKDLTRCPPACSRGALLIGAAFPERHLDFDVALFGGYQGASKMIRVPSCFLLY